MKNKTKGLLAAYGMVLPAFLVVMLTVTYPIVSAVIQSFQDEDTGAFTTANYTYFFTETAQRNNLLYTLFVVIVTVVIAIVLAAVLMVWSVLGISSGTVSAVCQIPDLESHRHAVPASAICTDHVCRVCDDHDHP